MFLQRFLCQIYVPCQYKFMVPDFMFFISEILVNETRFQMNLGNTKILGISVQKQTKGELDRK